MRRDFRQLGLADGLVRQRRSKSGWPCGIEWLPIEPLLPEICVHPVGGHAYAILTHVRLLLVWQGYGLSDEGLDAAVDDRLSVRRLAGITLGQPVPDHSSSWRLREQLSKRRLGDRLLAEVNCQVGAKGLILRRGTLIDATIVDAAVKPPVGKYGEVAEQDPEAGWTKKAGKSRSGYKDHLAVDRGSELIRTTIQTSADVHDSRAGDALVQGNEQAVYTDKAYDDEARRQRLREACIKDRIKGKAKRNQPLKPWETAFNKAVAPMRAGAVEETFGTMKRSYCWTRARYLGRARNATHLGLLPVAINLCCALKLQAARSNRVRDQGKPNDLSRKTRSQQVVPMQRSSFD